MPDVPGSGVPVKPASYPSQTWVACDLAGGNYNFLTADDLASPDALDLASPSGAVAVLVDPATPVTVPAEPILGLHSHVIYDGASHLGTDIAWPGVIVRSHDANISWYQLNPSNGVYNWTPLDRWLAEVQRVGATPMYTIFGTPAWCSSSASQVCHYPVLGAAAPPTAWSYLQTFLTALLAHIGSSTILRWEFWNECNIQVAGGVAAYWSGTNQQLADGLKAANATLKAANAANQIVGPSSQGWGQGLGGVATNGNDPSAWLPGFLTTTATAGAAAHTYMDQVGVHLYYPYGIVRHLGSMVVKVRTALTTAGIPTKPIFDTESGFIEVEDGTYPYSDAKLARLLKQQLFSILASGVVGSNLYSYDHPTMGIKNRTAVTVAFAEIRAMLAGATVLWAYQYRDGSILASVRRQGITRTVSL